MKTFTSLRDYLLSLRSSTLQELYGHPAACLAVFRDLPPLAKELILRLLFIESPIQQQMISSSVMKGAQREYEQVVKVITSLKLWSEAPGSLPSWVLNDKFRVGLKTALLGGGQPWSISRANPDPKHPKDISSLDGYAMERWEAILHYMVGSREAASGREKIGGDTISTLREGGLVADSDTSAAVPMITADGFQFLLMDTSSQVFYFMTRYLERVEQKGISLIQALSLLFQLSFCTLGKVYSSEGLHQAFQPFLQNLREFGLIHQRTRKDPRFYPTRLAINLFSGLRDKTKDISKPGFAIVETNYRVYAYTESPLQVALLALFVEMNYRFPAFCLGLLTRDSVRQALRSGITASQIINFLTINAHPSVKKKGEEEDVQAHRSVVPPTVMDQIRLWEKERDRFIFKKGVLYNQFLSQNDFDIVKNYARDSGVLIWDSPAKRSIIVTDEGHEDVRQFWKRYRKSAKS